MKNKAEENQNDGLGGIVLNVLKLSEEDFKKIRESAKTWNWNDERKQLEQASFARSTLLFSLFSAYCITLTLLFVKLPGSNEASLVEPFFKLIFSISFFFIFLFIAAMLKRTNDKCRILCRLLKEVEGHPYRDLHSIYTTWGESLSPVLHILFILTRREPFWIQNIVAFFPAIVALLICGLTVGHIFPTANALDAIFSNGFE
jgi:hypothetical protein